MATKGSSDFASQSVKLPPGLTSDPGHGQARTVHSVIGGKSEPARSGVHPIAISYVTQCVSSYFLSPTCSELTIGCRTQVLEDSESEKRHPYATADSDGTLVSPTPVGCHDFHPGSRR